MKNNWSPKKKNLSQWGSRCNRIIQTVKRIRILQEFSNQTINEQQSINNLILELEYEWIITKHLYQERITRSCDQDLKLLLEDTWSKYISKEQVLLWSECSDDEIINKIVK